LWIVHTHTLNSLTKHIRMGRRPKLRTRLGMRQNTLTAAEDEVVRAKKSEKKLTQGRKHW
jgi:hypothetical protein